jgi:hypothetical protein
MNRSLKIAAFLALAFALIGAVSFVSARSSSGRGRVLATPPVFLAQPSDPPQSATKHSLQGTYLSVGNGVGTAISADTYTPIDAAQTVTCPGPVGSCTLLANQFIVTRGSAASNNYAICLYIDGSLRSGGCYYAADTPDDGTFVFGSTSQWEVGVPVGTHTMQTVLFSNDGCTYDDYQFQYLVYKP